MFHIPPYVYRVQIEVVSDVNMNGRFSVQQTKNDLTHPNHGSHAHCHEDGENEEVAEAKAN